MKRRSKPLPIIIKTILLVVFWYCLTGSAGYNLTADQTGRLRLQKEYPQPEENVSRMRRVHPAESYLRSGREVRVPSRIANFDKLLVLLVDFQEDNDPNTTGNGKFMLEPDPDYPISLGAPPHDYQYFDAHLQAMRYYYLAASLGNYDLKYDIFPLEEDEKFAYTLPRQMAYYNPGMDNYNLFIQRIEEYFRDVFLIADSYGEIDFAEYGHYMIIHAGSDWQHDIYGDTPSDLPSFFIQVGEGKEVWVNDGTVKISNACNVPETISQDGRYGVINAVMAHEFGHSLGFVDLYNVNNFYPAVGYWDIMDSGGTGRLVTEGNDGELYAIEGGLPTLPNAWHRLMVWEDSFRDMGVYKEITEFRLDTAIPLTAASSLYDRDNPLPYFVKVPLNSTEYLLLENRHVDPDGDGGIAFRGAAPLTPGGFDYRVLLHPIGVYDDNLKPIYEYDWLLPGWMNRYGESFGGGIIVWHIDEQVIYNEGIIDSEGNFRSNYENNRVNTNYHRRGVRIIEADNIKDIGNPYSWYWYGTEYEPYFRYKPLIDEDGFFNGWSIYDEFNRVLSSNSKPPLLTNRGNPSIFKIYDISSSDGLMTFKYTYEPFEHTGILSEYSDTEYLAPPAGSSFLSARYEIPVFTGEGVRFFRHFYNPQNNEDEWIDFFGAFPFPYVPDYPVIVREQTGYPTQYYVAAGNKIIRISDDVGNYQKEVREFADKLSESPLLIETEDNLLLIVPTENELVVWSELDEETVGSFSLPEARICFDGSSLTVYSDGYLHSLSIETLSGGAVTRNDISTIKSVELPQAAEAPYNPVAYIDEANEGHNAVFMQNSKGDVYKLSQNSLSKLFRLETYTNKPATQLALGNIDDQVYLFFAAGEYLFALDIYGILAQDYPRFLENRDFTSFEEMRILNIDGSLILVLPVKDEGYLLYDFAEGIMYENSIVWNRPDFPDYFYWEGEEGTEESGFSNRLYFFFADNDKNLYESVFTTSEKNPIIWNGYRNNGWSVYEGKHVVRKEVYDTVNVYAFPNPARDGEVRIRIEGASDIIELQLFDITGKRLFNKVYDQNIGSRHEILWNTADMATGVYFGIVKTNGRTADFKVAIER